MHALQLTARGSIGLRLDDGIGGVETIGLAEQFFELLGEQGHEP